MSSLENLKYYTKTMRERLERHLSVRPQSPDEYNEYLHYLIMSSQGRCGDCGAALKLADVKKSDDQELIVVECDNGHKSTVVLLEETTVVEESFSATSLGEEDGKQKISSRLVNWRPKKEDEEILTVKRYVNYKGLKIKDLYNDVENSPVDVLVNTIDGCKYYFQVTKLYDEDFWSRLYKNSAIDYYTNTLSELISKAVNRKANWDKMSTEKIILLIDGWPGVSLKFIDCSNNLLLSIAEKSNFKEIWIVGQSKDSICRLWPAYDGHLSF